MAVALASLLFEPYPTQTTKTFVDNLRNLSYNHPVEIRGKTHDEPPKAEPRPTEAELSILKVLWRQGSSTVRSVLERMTAER